MTAKILNWPHGPPYEDTGGYAQLLLSGSSKVRNAEPGQMELLLQLITDRGSWEACGYQDPLPKNGILRFEPRRRVRGRKAVALLPG
jgi:hypothetical protein